MNGSLIYVGHLSRYVLISLVWEYILTKRKYEANDALANCGKLGMQVVGDAWTPPR